MKLFHLDVLHTYLYNVDSWNDFDVKERNHALFYEELTGLELKNNKEILNHVKQSPGRDKKPELSNTKYSAKSFDP
jgi:hypothetical protein